MTKTEELAKMIDHSILHPVYTDKDLVNQCAVATQSPVTGNSITNVNVNISGLTLGTTYHYRIKAVNTLGTAYGSDLIFTTVNFPTLNTAAITNITINTANSGGNITSDGGSPVTARGICWSRSANPTTTDNVTTDGAGTGSYTSNITGLAPGTTSEQGFYISWKILKRM
jgi:hypothetical protein